MIGVLVGNPKQVDRRSTQVGLELFDEVSPGRFARVAATGAVGPVAGVDEDVSPVREIDECGESFADVEEMNGHAPAAAAGCRGRRGRTGKRRRTVGKIHPRGD